MISEYGEWLRTQTNRHGRPFQAETISAYRDAAVALSAWMTSAGLEADFTGCDTAALNRFFRAYLAAHSQGGTNTKQRNLRHLFTWLAVEYGHQHPYTDALVRYAGQGPAVDAGGRLHPGPACGHRGRAGAGVSRRPRPRDDPGTDRGSASGRAGPDLPGRPPGRSDRPALYPGGAAQGRAGGRRGPHRPADARDFYGDRDVPAGAAVARAGSDLAGAVAGDPEPGADDRLRRVPDGQAASRRSRVRAVGAPRTCSGTPSPTTGWPAAGRKAI